MDAQPFCPSESRLGKKNCLDAQRRIPKVGAGRMSKWTEVDESMVSMYIFVISATYKWNILGVIHGYITTDPNL